MANPLETKTAPFSLYSALNGADRLAVQLRFEGRSYEAITATIKSEFGISKSENSVRGWFIAGGRLEAAYMQYTDTMSDIALREAKLLAKRLSKSAIATLGELIKAGHDDTVRLGAAKAIANKYVPDRQVVVDGGNDDDVPSQLMNDMEGALDDIRSAGDGKPDSDQPDADAPGSESTEAEVRERADEGLAEEVLPERDPADDTSIS